MLVHLAGARGFHDNIEWRLPTASHADFAEMAINQVKAPTKNRHFIADGDAIKPFAVSVGDIDLATTDLLTMDVVDSVRTVIESIALPPPAIPGSVSRVFAGCQLPPVPGQRIGPCQQGGQSPAILGRSRFVEWRLADEDAEADSLLCRRHHHVLRLELDCD